MKIGCLVVLGIFVLLMVIGALAGPIENADGDDLGQADAETLTASAEEKVVNKPGINANEFGRLRTGMSHSQVTAIVGSEGEILSESEIAGIKTTMYSWEGEGGFGANANAMFQDGRLIQKAQFGLD